MNSKRRGLSTALSVTPEIEQFIRPDQKSSESDSSEAISNYPTAEEAEQSDKKSEAAASQQNRFSQPLVAISTRFHPTTAEKLRRTSLERKLANKSPWSLQEIIQQAVQEWLREES